jgi:hypothetical protein
LTYCTTPRPKFEIELWCSRSSLAYSSMNSWNFTASLTDVAPLGIRYYYCVEFEVFLTGLRFSFRGFFADVSSNALLLTPFLAFWLKAAFFRLSSPELELSSESEEEGTLSPELLLDKYLLLLLLDIFVLLKSAAGGFPELI